MEQNGGKEWPFNGAKYVAFEITRDGRRTIERDVEKCAFCWLKFDSLMKKMACQMPSFRWRPPARCPWAGTLAGWLAGVCLSNEPPRAKCASLVCVGPLGRPPVVYV